MPSAPYLKILVFVRHALGIAVALFLLSPLPVHATPQKQILVLHSYSQEYPWTQRQHEGFTQTLYADTSIEFLVSTEYLDTKRRAYDALYAKEMARHLQQKYQDYKPAALYVTDDNALLFARDHLTHIFPGVPVFFSGINDYGVRSSLDPALFTGVFERKEFAPNITWLLQLDKDANDLIFVGDGSNTYQAIESELRNDLASSQLRVTFVSENRLDRIMARLNNLPGKYLFLTTLGSITDEKKQLLPLGKILKSLVSTGRIVISMEDAYIFEGVLGGYVTSGRKQGTSAAQLLLAYLHGKPLTGLSPIMESPNELIFDDRALQQHGITLPDKIRSEAVLLHPRSGFFVRHSSLIVSVFIVLVTLLLSVVTVAYALVSRKNRELRRAQATAEAANQLFTQLAEQSRTIHWEVDADGLYTYVSPVVEEVIGYRPEELIGKKYFYEFHSAAGLEASKTAYFATFASKKPFLNQENILLTRDEREIWVSSNGIPLIDDNGNLEGYRGSDTDISMRKLAETEKLNLQERLNRAEKMEALGVLAGGVAHDLNNVLGVIVGFSELLMMKNDTDNQLKSQLEAINSGVMRAAAIVQDMLTLARRGVTVREIVNLNVVVADLQALPEYQQLLAYHPSVEITLALEPDLPNMSGTSVLLGKALFNLISNGCEAMPKGGTLTIKTATEYLDKPINGYDAVKEGYYVVLSVSDTGEGISATDLKRIFEPFYTKKVMGRSGTGLGLAVVWGTVKDNQGYITVNSLEGQGSTFTLYFPTKAGEISCESGTVPLSEYMGKGESILIIDDVKGQRELACEILKQLNYDVSTVASGEEAIAFLKEKTCDLIVLDMIMEPGMDGLDTYQKALGVRAGQKAVIVSGFSESDRVHAAQELGAGTYVKKPYTFEELGLAVRKELDRSP